jgi:multidrug efflux pump subunit AcrB
MLGEYDTTRPVMDTISDVLGTLLIAFVLCCHRRLPVLGSIRATLMLASGP